MSSVLDVLLVGGALLASLVYALMSLGPRSWRRHIATALAACGLTRLAPKAAGSCGSCDDCASSEASKPAAGGETRVPLADIGRRKP